MLNLEPYTISTATTGSCAFVEYDDISANPAAKNIAIGAIRWLLSVVGLKKYAQ